MKKPRPFRMLAIILVVVLALVVFVYLTFGHRPLWAYIAELRARGEKVTFPEMSASLSTNTDTSLAALTNAVLKLSQMPVDSTNLGAMHYIEPGRAEVAWRLPRPPWSACTHDPTTSTWSGASKRVVELTASLGALRDAARHSPVNGGRRTEYIAEAVTPFRTVRSAACWLVFAALADLHDGRNTDALADAQALAGLANLHREEYSMVSAMVRVATAHLGIQVTWEALRAPGWDGDQLLAMQRAWEMVDLLDGLERGMEGQRCFSMEAFNKFRAERQRASQTNKNSSSPIGDLAFQKIIGPLYTATVIDNDLLFGLRNVQAKVEMVRSLRANRSLKEVLASLEQTDALLERKCHSPVKFFYLMSAISIPNFRRAFITTTQTETERRLAITAIALSRYQLKNGRPAPGLDALVPGFIAAIPRDCMSGRPLCYQLHADGTFALYSVGMDGIDNGGEPSPAASDREVGLWEGRDAVWPMAAEQKLTALRLKPEAAPARHASP